METREFEYFETANDTAKCFGYSLEMDDKRIMAIPDLDNNQYLPDIFIEVGKELVINFPSEMSRFSLSDFSAFIKEMENAEKCAKVVQNLYNNTLAVRLENIKL